MQKTKLDITNRHLYDTKIMEEAKDDGFAYLPDEEKIERDKIKFKEFFEKYGD